MVEAFMVDRFGNRPQQFQALKGPVVQGVAWDMQSQTLKNALLSIEGAVVRIFGDDQFRSEPKGRHATSKGGGWGRCNDGGLITTTFTTKLGPNVTPFDEAGWLVIK